MPAYAYLVLLRNDLAQHGLQVLDLKPNTSNKSSVYTPPGQTGYKSFLAQNDSPADNGGNPKLASKTMYGLSAYLLDNVANGGANYIGTTLAAACADAILAAAAAGQALTSADVGALLVGAGCAGGTLLDGNNSTGSVSDLLKILAGYVFKIPNGAQLSTGATGFRSASAGYFVSRPNVARDFAHPGGRKSGEWVSSPIGQTGTEDLAFRDMVTLLNTPDLQLSALSGNLSKLKSSTFSFFNGSYTYGASGTAELVDGTKIGTSYQAPAVVVYDASGNVL